MTAPFSNHLTHNAPPNRVTAPCRKCPNALKGGRWSAAAESFPQENRWKNTKTGEEGRHHVDESLVQKAVRDAVTRAGLQKLDA